MVSTIKLPNSQMKLPIRGYSLCDNDWREYPLRRLNELGIKEAELLGRLEDENEEMTDHTYNTINTMLDSIQAEMKQILGNYVAPVLYRWWVTEEGRKI